MVLKKVWIPVDSAFVAPGTRASYETANGQLYVVESGREYVIHLILRNHSKLALKPLLSQRRDPREHWL